MYANCLLIESFPGEKLVLAFESLHTHTQPSLRFFSAIFTAIANFHFCHSVSFLFAFGLSFSTFSTEFYILHLHADIVKSTFIPYTYLLPHSHNTACICGFQSKMTWNVETALYVYDTSLSLPSCLSFFWYVSNSMSEYYSMQAQHTNAHVSVNNRKSKENMEFARMSVCVHFSSHISHSICVCVLFAKTVHIRSHTHIHTSQ